MSAFATVTRITYGNINFLHAILRSSSFEFPLLILTVYSIKVQNTIYKLFPLTIFTTSWHDLNEIGWSKLHRILIYLTETYIYYVNLFWIIVSKILKYVSACKTNNDALRVFVIRLPPFIIPKITVVWHLKPSLKLHDVYLPCLFGDSLYP